MNNALEAILKKAYMVQFRSRAVIVFATTPNEAHSLGKSKLEIPKSTGIHGIAFGARSRFDKYAVMFDDHITFDMIGDKVYRKEGWSDFPEKRCKTCGLAQFDTIKSSELKDGVCLRCKAKEEYNYDRV